MGEKVGNQSRAVGGCHKPSVILKVGLKQFPWRWLGLIFCWGLVLVWGGVVFCGFVGGGFGGLVCFLELVLVFFCLNVGGFCGLFFFVFVFFGVFFLGGFGNFFGFFVVFFFCGLYRGKA